MGRATAIGHVDADCFYVSAERVRSDFLLGKPVGVLGNQGAFFIAKSYEMKNAGVKTGDAICYRDGRSAAGRVDLLALTDRFDLLADAARAALGRCLLPRQVVNRLHVVATDLRYPGAQQLGLFDPPAGRAEALARLKREVNERLGRFALRSGATLFLREVYKDEAYGYEVCDVRGKMCF
jgi:hypothetical protein